jgi:hypothetical protein
VPFFSCGLKILDVENSLDQTVFSGDGVGMGIDMSMHMGNLIRIELFISVLVWIEECVGMDRGVCGTQCVNSILVGG